jgi:acyl-CoA synthetase (AMP-forming)/AMP-acid ligase II
LPSQTIGKVVNSFDRLLGVTVSTKLYNLREAVTYAKKKFGARVFIDPYEDHFDPITYNDLDHFVNCYSEFLKSYETPEMEKVAVVSGAATMTALLCVGTIACDRIFVPIDARSTKAEVLHCLDQVTPGLIICDPAHREYCEAWARGNGARTSEVVDGRALYDRIVSRAAKPFKSKCCSSDMAELVFTSGATGEPKAVVLSQGAIIANALSLIERYGVTADDHFMVAVPISQCASQIFSLLCPLLLGASTTAVEQKLALTKFWDIAAEHKVTWSVLVAAFLPVLLQTNPHATPLKGLLLGGSAVSAEPIERFEAKFSIPIYQAYAMTEVAGVAVCEPLERSNRTIGSVGKPLDIAAIRIVSRDLRELAQPEHGEVCIKSASRFTGYFKDPTATDSEMLNGYVKTGDVGFIDGNGNLNILGRAHDTFDVGSENLHPAEIEA